MKLAAIYNVWDAEEFLLPSMKCLDGHVDLFIVVYQNQSNFGEVYNPMANGLIQEIQASLKTSVEIGFYIPVIGGTNSDGTVNEINKRNHGIEIAKRESCSHFLFVDCDEFYQDFGKAKQLYVESRKCGSVCSIQTYFGKPDLAYADLDNYFVPFIHELNRNTVAGWRKYPFYVDPTRRVNCNDVAKLPVIMHHYSWVRKDLWRKINNSSARVAMRNLTTILEDYKNANEGMIVRDMSNRKLVKVPDFFNLKPIFQ